MLIFLLIAIGLSAFILCIVGYGLWIRRRRRRLIAQRAWEQWKNMSRISDSSRRVLEAENILDRALRDIGYQGTFGEKLKRMQRTLPNIDAVWHAHKLRNRLAHEPGLLLRKEEGERAVSAFEKALKTLLPSPLFPTNYKLPTTNS